MKTERLYNLLMVIGFMLIGLNVDAQGLDLDIRDLSDDESLEIEVVIHSCFGSPEHSKSVVLGGHRTAVLSANGETTESKLSSKQINKLMEEIRAARSNDNHCKSMSISSSRMYTTLTWKLLGAEVTEEFFGFCGFGL